MRRKRYMVFKILWDQMNIIGQLIIAHIVKLFFLLKIKRRTISTLRVFCQRFCFGSQLRKKQMLCVTVSYAGAFYIVKIKVVDIPCSTNYIIYMVLLLVC